MKFISIQAFAYSMRLSFQVLLMLQCLNKATKLEPNSPDLHVAAAKYLHYCNFSLAYA